MARSEVERRGQYFEQLEDLLPGRIRQVIVLLIKNCLHNDPSQRPTAEQLVSSLEEMKGEVEGAYGELATVDAVRQVRTVKALKAKGDSRVDEIQQLHEQLEVKLYIHIYILFYCNIIVILKLTTCTDCWSKPPSKRCPTRSSDEDNSKLEHSSQR